METTTDTAARRRPGPLVLIRAIGSAATWRALAHLVTGAVIGFTGGFTLLCLGLVAVLGAPTVIVPIAACAVIIAFSGALTALQRSRHGAFLYLRLPQGRSEATFTLNPRTLIDLFGNRKTWYRLAYHFIAACYGLTAAFAALAAWVLGAVLIPAPLYWADPEPGVDPLLLSGVGLVLVLAAPWVTRGLADLDARMARRLLGISRSEELELRITDLAASRDSTVDAADAERRRIERDLHDGVQQRITALAMNLGIARETLADVSEPGARALEQAHEEAKQALADLRDLVRGLHPAVLEDRGLDAALSAVAARSPVPVRVAVDMDRRVDGDVEAVAYFVVSEALTNVARHAGAARAAVEVALRGETLHVTVTDDGAGGADPGGGTGLRGLADRVRSVDGTFELTSPAGGPTTIEVELPCASS
ncbi:sensor histidine kinase [Glycomyces xiaoerkulensis]|uniref:sensor histidine kinase n=1 Tax=Glycomyces xiaoerkulensis TaxID=2038139 RepID=UPI000C25D7E5|nr:sensor domain-containing protein [Glycomyces xiaoerkulensis]